MTQKISKKVWGRITTMLATGAIVIGMGGGLLFLVNHENTDGIPEVTAANSNSGESTLIDKPVPQFSLKDRNGTVYSPKSLKGKNFVLFFNEGIMCYPACWNQMVALATDNRLQTEDTVTLSVVIDSPREWQRAIAKMPALGKATVLFDTDKSVSDEFGMLTMRSSMHYGSFPGHSFVVIDKQGIIRFVYDDPKMGIDNDRVVAALQALN